MVYADLSRLIRDPIKWCIDFVMMDTILFGFLIGISGSLLIKRFGMALGMNDMPNQRSSHSRIVPKGAGIGILAVFIVECISYHIPFYLLGPAVGIALISLWGGDKQKMSSRQRLACHFLLAFLFLLSCPFDVLRLNCSIPILVLFAIFIVGTANFYNFMDGIDGMAGLSGVISFLLLAGYIYLKEFDESYAFLAIALSFSCAGFLCFNFPKARVFMGDVGSILLGFVFACLVLMLSSDIVDFMVMISFLFPFYFDELITMVVRIRRKESLLKPHRKHLYQLMVNELAFPHWKISMAYGMAQSFIGVIMIMAQLSGLAMVLVSYIAVGIGLIIFSTKIYKQI